MKVYVTKHCLTRGITREEVETTHTPTMVAGACGAYYHRFEWFEKWEDALSNAEKRKTARFNSLARSMSRLKLLKFTKPK